MDGTARRNEAAWIARAAGARSGEQAVHVDQCRPALTRLSAPDDPSGDARACLLAVERSASIDEDAPTASSRASDRLVKHVVKRLTSWYLRYLGAQVTLLGHAIVRFGTAIVERTERLEETTDRLGADVASLEARMDRLEQDVAG